MAVEISAEARQYVNDTFAPVAEYLLTGDGFRSAGPGPRGEQTGGEWESIFAELTERGFMRRSNTGRYWWAGSKPGRPEVGEPVNVRLGDLLPEVDEFAAARGGTSRAAAIRELVSRGLGTAKVTPDRAPVYVLEFGCSNLGAAIDIARQCVPVTRPVPSVREQGRLGYEVASDHYEFIERMRDRCRSDGYEAIVGQR